MNKKTTAAKPAERTRVAKATVPEPEPIEIAQAAKSPERMTNLEGASQVAYEYFRASQNGDFGEWADLSQRARNLYEDGARHVIDGGEPRTDFERVVVEVLHG